MVATSGRDEADKDYDSLSEDYEYEDYTVDSSIVTSTTDEFDRGVVIPAGVGEGQGVTAAFGGYLPVPTAGADGRCVEANYATFFDPVRAPNTCIRCVRTRFLHLCVTAEVLSGSPNCT